MDTFLDHTCFLWYFRMITTHFFSYFLSHVLLLLQKIFESVFLKRRKREKGIEGARERINIGYWIFKVKVIIKQGPVRLHLKLQSSFKFGFSSIFSYLAVKHSKEAPPQDLCSFYCSYQNDIYQVICISCLISFRSSHMSLESFLKHPSKVAPFPTLDSF